MRWLVVVFLLVGISRAEATYWFVNGQTGNDSNDGLTLGSQFLTLNKANSVVAPGDTVYVQGSFGGGSSGTPSLTLSTSGSGAGTSAATPCSSQITYQGYTGPFQPTGGATAVPGYPRPILNGTKGLGIIYGVNPLSCITINYVELAGWNGEITAYWPGASQNAGLSGTGWQSPVYTGNCFHLQGSIGGTGSTSVHHIMVLNSVVHDCPGAGININFGDYLTIEGNVVYNNGLYSPYAGSGISLYELHNIDAGTGTKNIVANNIAFSNIEYIPENAANAGSTTGSGTSTTGATNITVTSSATANFIQNPIDVTNGCIQPGTFIINLGTGFITLSLPITCNITGATTILFSYVTDGEGMILDNNTNSQSDNVPYIGRTSFFNNLGFNNGAACITIAPQSKNADVYNNTCYQNQQFFNTSASAGQSNSELYDLAATGLNVYNNVFVGPALAPTLWDQSTNTTVYSNNAVSGGNGGRAVPGSNNVLGNPMLVNPTTSLATANFQLKRGSPAIGVGSASFTRPADIVGNLVGASPPGVIPGGPPLPDIGAYTQPCTAMGTITYQINPTVSPPCQPR